MSSMSSWNVVKTLSFLSAPIYKRDAREHVSPGLPARLPKAVYPGRLTSSTEGPTDSQERRPEEPLGLCQGVLPCPTDDLLAGILLTEGRLPTTDATLVGHGEPELLDPTNTELRGLRASLWALVGGVRE